MSAPPAPGRRLAAVWFADIVGYTALSSRDEDAALAVVAAFQRIADEVVSQHSGRVVKYIGDAALAEFASVDGAIRSALVLMERFLEDDVARRQGSTLRVGVNVGEVISSPDGDIYGDGVNLASRLQNQADPGQVIASEAVHAQIRQRPVFRTEPLGQRTVKGVAGPVTLYAVSLQDGGAPPTEAPQRGDGAPGAEVRPLPTPRWRSPVTLGVAALAVVAATLAILDPGGVIGRLGAGWGRDAVRASYAVVEGGMEIGGAVTLTFASAVDPSTATSANVRLVDAEGDAVPAEVSLGDGQNTLVLRPREALAYASTYTLLVADALLDERGEPLGSPPVTIRTQPVPVGGAPALTSDTLPARPRDEPGANRRVTDASPQRPATQPSPSATQPTPTEAAPAPAGPVAGGGAPSPVTVTPGAERSGPATLNVTASPPAALPFLKVVVNGDTLGSPPQTGIRVAEGRTHTVTLVGVPELSSFSLVVFTREVAAQPGQTLDVSAQITAFGSIDVVSQPAGTVFVDGRQVGRTPLAGYPVTAGVVHRLEIRPLPADAARHAPYRGEFRVEPLEWKSLGRVTLPASGGGS